MDKNLNNLFVISSPSGGGKSSLIEALLSDPNAKRLSLSISFTTRSRRSNEKNGKNYYFVNSDEFKKKIKNNDFLESAEVFKNFYGTDKKITEELLKTRTYNTVRYSAHKEGNLGTEIFPKLSKHEKNIFLMV